MRDAIKRRLSWSGDERNGYRSDSAAGLVGHVRRTGEHWQHGFGMHCAIGVPVEGAHATAVDAIDAAELVILNRLRADARYMERGDFATAEAEGKVVRLRATP